MDPESSTPRAIPEEAKQHAASYAYVQHLCAQQKNLPGPEVFPGKVDGVIYPFGQYDAPRYTFVFHYSENERKVEEKIPFYQVQGRFIQLMKEFLISERPANSYETHTLISVCNVCGSIGTPCQVKNRCFHCGSGTMRLSA
jgi:hypothetical protein